MSAETLDECLARVQLMAESDSKWDLSPNDRHALTKTLMEIIHLREKLRDAHELLTNVPIHSGYEGWEEQIRAWLRGDPIVLPNKRIDESLS